MTLRFLSRKKIKPLISDEYSKNYGTRKFFNLLFISISIVVLIRWKKIMFSTVCIVFLLLCCFLVLSKKLFSYIIKLGKLNVLE